MVASTMLLRVGCVLACAASALAASASASFDHIAMRSAIALAANSGVLKTAAVSNTCAPLRRLRHFGVLFLFLPLPAFVCLRVERLFVVVLHVVGNTPDTSYWG